MAHIVLNSTYNECTCKTSVAGNTCLNKRMGIDSPGW